MKIEEYKKQIEEIRRAMPKESDAVICSVLQEINKDRRSEIMQGEKPKEKATEKQKNYLKELGYQGNFDISKQEASKLIEELKQ